MPTALLQILSLVAALVPALGKNGDAIAKIVKTLTELVAAGIQEIQTVAPMVKNIIAALRDTGALTDEQKAQLDASEQKVDADFDAAAKAEGFADLPSDPVPADSPAPSGQDTSTDQSKS